MQFLVDNLEVISLIAFVIGVVITIWKDSNLGILAIGLAFVIGHMIGGISVRDIIDGYPSRLLLILVGVTYFFGVAQTNGTLEKLTNYTIKSVKSNVAILPIVLFFLAVAISSIGPGQIATSAMFAAPAMALTIGTGINPLLMAIVVASGAQAGALSPLTPNGIIANNLIAELGIAQDYSLTLWFHSLLTFFASALIAYVVFGGLKLWKKGKIAGGVEHDALKNIKVEPFTLNQKITLAAIALLVFAAVVLELDVGFVAIVLGFLLTLFKIGDERAIFKVMPWGAIILVTGVTVLISLMEDIGGIELFADIMGRFSNPFTVTLVVGFVAAIVSAYASTSGVIMPAFMPMAPILLEVIGAPPAALVPLLFAICIAGHLTDVSPLSTTGAVFIGGAPASIERRPLFNGMLIWGIAMSFFAAVIVWLFYSVFNLIY